MEFWIIAYLIGACVGSFAVWYYFWLSAKKKCYNYLVTWMSDFEHRIKRGGDYREFVKKKH